ncbi:MAG TPA: LysR family transcriptional regulator [Gaiellaceae bacterium]|jgi:molybdate transport repressor ModE-like protein|nr:LysR family transcriptional regulator [Gaiellaceae bacterium]
MTVAADHPSGIEIRHLTALEAVAEEGSFRRAATRLGYVQSAISEQIAALERIVGQRLVERSRGAGALELTEAGEILLAHATAIVGRVKAAEADLGALADGSAGSLRLGIYQSVGARVIPRLLPRYARDWPDVRVLPREAPTDAGLFEFVERGELELSFADLPLHPGPFESVELLRDPYVLLVAADSPLALEGGPVGLDDIAELPLIGHWTCRVLPRVEAELRAQGVEPNFVFRSDILSTVQALVGAGVGSAIIPRLGIDLSDTRTAVVQLDEGVPVQPRVISLFWHRDRYRSPASVGFVEAAREVCTQLTAELDGTVRPLVRRSRSA